MEIQVDIKNQEIHVRQSQNKFADSEARDGKVFENGGLKLAMFAQAWLVHCGQVAREGPRGR